MFFGPLFGQASGFQSAPLMVALVSRRTGALLAIDGSDYSSCGPGMIYSSYRVCRARGACNASITRQCGRAARNAMSVDIGWTAKYSWRLLDNIEWLSI